VKPSAHVASVRCAGAVTIGELQRGLSLPLAATTACMDGTTLCFQGWPGWQAVSRDRAWGDGRDHDFAH
jgi:hypothetical protein